VRVRLRVTDRGRRLQLTPAGTRTSRAGAGKEGKTRWGAVTRPARKGGMSQLKPPSTTLPHHKLFAYDLCLALVKLVAKIRIADAQLRAQARKSAASSALNCAEGAARQTRADKSRAYAIALCECCEACAAIEIAGALGACSAADVEAVVALGTRAKNILSRLVR
jgi:four helix bundle protein